MRKFTVIGCLVLTVACHAACSARLSFYNATKSTGNTGALLADPGDTIEVWYSFHNLDNVNPFKWGTIRITFCMEGLTIVGEQDFDSWDQQIQASKSQGGPAGDFLTTVIGRGVLYDNSIDPSDINSPLISTHGLYMLLGGDGNKVRSQSWDVMFYRFTVQPGSEHEELNWCLDGRVSSTGLSTSILDQKGKTVDLTDNYVQVTPEPAAAVALLGPLVVLRRKRNA
jgi:hypothetical protein